MIAYRPITRTSRRTEADVLAWELSCAGWFSRVVRDGALYVVEVEVATP